MSTVMIVPSASSLAAADCLKRAICERRGRGATIPFAKSRGLYLKLTSFMQPTYRGQPHVPTRFLLTLLCVL
jgi:hypothetical protein